MSKKSNDPRIHKTPRYWSNSELKRFAHLFKGKIVNVSAWKDEDKQGRHYRDYFTSSNEYWITNYKAGMRGQAGLENELFLNLENDLPENLLAGFDVVFNHTTLEHIYNFQKALDNLVLMTRDILILVVPVLQQVHVAPDPDSQYDPEYGDFWRFTPQGIDRLLHQRGMSTCYISFNTHRRASVYAFCIATKQPEIWKGHFPMAFSHIDESAVGQVKQPWAGCNAFRLPFYIENPINKIYNIKDIVNKLISFFSRKLKAIRGK